MQSKTNEELALAVKAGDAGAFDQLWAQVEAFAWMKAAKYLPFAERNGGADLDDLHQLAALGVWRAARSFEGGRGVPFLSWAGVHIRMQIRRGLALDGRQRIENTCTASLDAPLPGVEDCTLADTLIDEAATDPLEAATQSNMRQIVREAVASLPPSERDIVAKHDLAGVPLAKIASETGLQVYQVKSRRKHAHQALRRKHSIQELATKGYYIYYSLGRFKRTFTSSVEAAVIDLERRPPSGRF